MNSQTTAQFEISKLLYAEFQRGKLRNPRFSLRAFAKRFRVSPSILSDFLAGKRTITKKTATTLLDQLSIDQAKKMKLLSEFGAKSAKKKRYFKVDTKIFQLELDQFDVISEWYNFALFALANVENFEATPEWIASRLGIRKRDARKALEKLTRLGLLREENGKIVRAKTFFTTTVDIPSTSIRKRLHQDLEIAADKLHEVPVEQRDFSSILMASHPQKLAEAKRRIENFRRELYAFMSEGSGPFTEVYQLNLQLFPILKSETGEKNENT